MQQPQKLTRDKINELIEAQLEGMAVTIYVPTNISATPPNMTEDQIRMKNLFHQAINMVEQKGDDSRLAMQLRDQLDAMLGEQDFWKKLNKGLLICASQDVMHMFYLPIDTEEYVAADDTYHLAPVLGLIQDAKDYFVLALAQHEPKLLRGSMYGLEMAEVELPESVEAGLHIDEVNQKSEQQRSKGNQNGMAFNGRGGARNPAEEDRQRFWRMIDAIITSKTDTALPLILAGTDSEIAEYRAVSHHQHITQGTIHGSFNESQLRELQDHAMEIVLGELTDPQHAQVTETYERLSGTQPDRVIMELDDIESAAAAGRVENLLISMMRRTTDTVRDNAEQVMVLSFHGGQKLQTAIEQAAVAVWKAGGKIINIEQSLMPQKQAYALATLRY